MGLEMVAVPSEYTLAELSKQAQAPQPLPRDRLDGPSLLYGAPNRGKNHSLEWSI